MATATRPIDIDPEVSHPLDRIRGTIRRYVVIEGLLSAAIFLVGWLILAVLLDFGMYRVFHLDWATDAPAWLRAAALILAGLMLAAIVALRVVRRLTRELSYPALALVLERRFPDVLRDRLITAVELADIDQATRQGYSADMVRKTITEARELVGTVPVRRVFNWRRLWLMGLLFVGLIAGFVGGGYAVFAAATGHTSANRYAWRFAHVVGPVLERDVMLDNVPWPRTSPVIELIDTDGFPPTTELRVGRGDKPIVRVRAIRWMVADRGERLGWRPMMWSDLRSDTVGLGDAPMVPFAPFEKIQGTQVRDEQIWSVDHVEWRIADLDEKIQPVRDTLQALDAKADELIRAGRLVRGDAPNEPVDYSKWVFLDREAGIQRPIRWGDLRDEVRAVEERNARGQLIGTKSVKKPGLLGINSLPDIPESVLVAKAASAGRPTASTPPTNWTIAQVAAHVDAIDKAAQPTRATLRELERLVDEPRMGRRIRLLDVPAEVNVLYSPPTEPGQTPIAPRSLPLKRAINRVFAGPLAETTQEGKETGLTRDIRYHAEAGGFATPDRDIRVINPPRFDSITLTRYEPVYLHYPPPKEGYEGLKNLYQRMPDQVMSMTESATVFPVPSGTGVVLTVTTDVPLRSAAIRPKTGIIPGAKPGSTTLVQRPLTGNKRSFTVELVGDYRLAPNRVITHRFTEDGTERVEQVKIPPLKERNQVEFVLVIEQEDGFKSERPVSITIQEDTAPVVSIRADGLRVAVEAGGRKLTVPCHIVTPIARIPLHPESVVKDDFGLSKVEWEFVYWAESSDELAAMRAAVQTRALLFPPLPGPVALPGVPTIAALGLRFADVEDRSNGTVPLPAFLERQPSIAPMTRAELEAAAQKPFPETAIARLKRVELNDPASRDFFDLMRLKIPVQPGFRLDLNIAAYDTNFDTGPQVGRRQVGNKDAPINFMVVSEVDLLALIGNDQLAQIKPLDDALAGLAQARRQFRILVRKNAEHKAAVDGGPDKNEVANALAAGKGTGADIRSSRSHAMTVARAYQRLYRECLINRINSEATEWYANFSARLDRIQSDQAAALPAGTYPDAEKQLGVVLALLAKENWADPAAVAAADTALVRLENELRAIRNMLGEELDFVQLKQQARSIKETQERLDRQASDWSKRIEVENLKPEPDIQKIAPLFVVKGETRKVRHTLNWRQYLKDDLNVKVEVSDKEALTVVPVLKLNFNDNLTDFTYEIRVGQKPGDYTITLTPEVGKPVVVNVNVK